MVLSDKTRNSRVRFLNNKKIPNPSRQSNIYPISGEIMGSYYNIYDSLTWIKAIKGDDSPFKPSSMDFGRSKVVRIHPVISKQ